MHDKFTIVFKGNIRKLDFNPHTAKTIFGEVSGASTGDLVAENNAMFDCILALEAIASGDGDPQEIARQTLAAIKS